MAELSTDPNALTHLFIVATTGASKNKVRFIYSGDSTEVELTEQDIGFLTTEWASFVDKKADDLKYDKTQYAEESTGLRKIFDALIAFKQSNPTDLEINKLVTLQSAQFNAARILFLQTYEN